MSSTLLNADTGRPVGDLHPLPVRIVARDGASGVPATTTPTLFHAVSTVVLAANSRRAYLLVRNDTVGTVMLSLSGDPLSGIAPTADNRGLVLPPGAAYESSPGYLPSGTITAYQASGAETNALTVVEGTADGAAAGGIPATTTPTLPSGSSAPILAANGDRRYLLIQNGTAGPIVVSLSGAALGGVAPGSTNVGVLIPPGEAYESSSGYVPTGAITAYQASGATTNAVVVVEG